MLIVLNGVFFLETGRDDSLFANDLALAYPLQLSTSVNLVIQVNDLDDNEPEFSATTLDKQLADNLEVDSTVLVLPIALDRDTLAQNVRVTYHIVSGNEQAKFELNETSGEIRLVDELDRKHTDAYSLLVRATSRRYTQPPTPLLTASTTATNATTSNNEMITDRSLIRVNLNVVPDRLFIEFDEQNYFVSYKLPSSPNHNKSSNNDTIMHRQYTFQSSSSPADNDPSSPIDTTPFSSNSNSNSNNFYQSNQVALSDQLRASAIFYARSHLKQRKLKRAIKFSVEMVQLMRANERTSLKLPLTLVASYHHANKSNNNNNTQAALFLLDEINGKVYMRRERLADAEAAEAYKPGDRFILTIAASSADTTTTATENTLTQLTVRLTEKDYSFIMPLRKQISLNDIMFNYLNPLRVKYIPRILEADGVKISIQDLIVLASSSSVSSSAAAAAPSYLIIQVETKFDHKQVDLDLFIDMWRNYSSSNAYLRELNSFIDRQPIKDARLVDDMDAVGGGSGSDFASSRPFYSSWLFWLLAIIGLLLFIILVFIVCCIKMSSKQHKQLKAQRKGADDFIIGYPPVVNPMYDGDSSSRALVAGKKRTATASRTNSQRVLYVEAEPLIGEQRDNANNTNFEEQELHMNIDDDMEFDAE